VAVVWGSSAPSQSWCCGQLWPAHHAVLVCGTTDTRKQETAAVGRLHTDVAASKVLEKTEPAQTQPIILQHSTLLMNKVWWHCAGILTNGMINNISHGQYKSRARCNLKNIKKTKKAKMKFCANNEESSLSASTIQAGLLPTSKERS
jgi:hypothetical protein